jgi:hypothetical protein
MNFTVPVVGLAGGGECGSQIQQHEKAGEFTLDGLFSVHHRHHARAHRKPSFVTGRTTMIDTRHQWIAELERLSPIIKTYDLTKTTLKEDTVYVDRTSNQRSRARDKDAFNISNSGAHNAIIVDAVAALQGKMPDKAIRTLLGELTSKKTYGAFSELVAYKWLSDAGVPFTAQVPMTGADVVNPNGTAADGQVTFPSGKVANFDIKGFGFIEHKTEILQKRLADEFPTDVVRFGGDWSLSIDTLQDLLDYNGFSSLVTDLQSTRKATRGALEFAVLKRQRMNVSTRSIDLTTIAQLNAGYPYRFTGQFTRHRPFFLVFMIHPWFGGGQLNTNFIGTTDHVANTLATGAFRSFINDMTLVEGITYAEASKLLSGLVFLNGWPATGTDAPQSKPFCRIYLNGGARHPLKVSDFDPFTNVFGDGVVIERIDLLRQTTSRRGLMTGLVVTFAVAALAYYFTFRR